MSIQDDAQLAQALAAITSLRMALASLHRDVRGRSSANYALLAEGPLDEIARIQSEVDTYLGLDDLRAHLWLRITGEGLSGADAPSAVLTHVLDSLRKGLQAGTEHAQRGTLSTRPTADIQRAVDLRLTVVAEGSLRLGLNILLPTQQEMLGVPGLEASAATTLREYFDTARWASDASAADDALSARIADPTRRRLLLQQLLAIVPRTRGVVETIEIRGRLLKEPEPILLTRATRTRVTAAIDRVVTEAAEQHEGELREIDLDKRTGVVRSTDAPDVDCEFLDELMLPAQEALGRRVRVVGVRPVGAGRRMKSLAVTRLEILEDDGSLTGE